MALTGRIAVCRDVADCMSIYTYQVMTGSDLWAVERSRHQDLLRSAKFRFRTFRCMKYVKPFFLEARVTANAICNVWCTDHGTRGQPRNMRNGNDLLHIIIAHTASFCTLTLSATSEQFQQPSTPVVITLQFKYALMLQVLSKSKQRTRRFQFPFVFSPVEMFSKSVVVFVRTVHL